MDIQQLQDEFAIRKLAEQYSDAANRVDAGLFRALWTADAEWIIGPPISRQFVGLDNIVTAFDHLLNSWDFFVQLSTSAHIQVTGATATANFYVNEIARSQPDGTNSNYNLARYTDELVKVDGAWLFRKRDYRVLYLDQTPLTGTAFHVR
ncbi:nuclear transport factor 2 family protein [Hymenobacter lapidiphilus]|uniref:Nuclear transport factor 2 family protein n=1 Tax=Hymenobacter lapidiphilus TaxID=2608003 RepID=A0A7Y7U695_9BACT|nr:nuclear transport factor 2 family protein [Hymenobacter lapidiphilus]NVO32278.1 nuclear transport factor 2 family protein [Hymenobacter lapidiphilus]